MWIRHGQWLCCQHWSKLFLEYFDPVNKMQNKRVWCDYVLVCAKIRRLQSCFGSSIRYQWSLRPVKFCLRLNKIIFGYFDPVNIFFDNKINNFWGDVSDISAKRASPHMTTLHSYKKLLIVRVFRGHTQPTCTTISNELKDFLPLTPATVEKTHNLNDLWFRTSVWTAMYRSIF